MCLCSSLPSWDYLPLHPADWGSTATLPRGCLQPCSNQSKASSFTTCTPGSAAAGRVEEKEGNSLGRDGDGVGRKEGEPSLGPLGPGRKCDGEIGGRSGENTPSPHVGSLGVMVTGRRERAEHRKSTDGDRGRCKRRRITGWATDCGMQKKSGGKDRRRSLQAEARWETGVGKKLRRPHKLTVAWKRAGLRLGFDSSREAKWKLSVKIFRVHSSRRTTGGDESRGKKKTQSRRRVSQDDYQC